MINRDDVGAAMDVAALRADTPGTGHACHFNAAGAALPSTTMLATIVDHLHLESRIGGYEAAEVVLPRIRVVYELAAEMLGAQESDIALVESATVGWQRAVDAFRLGPGDRVLVSSSSYVSAALHLLELRQSRGVIVEVLATDGGGRVDLDQLRSALSRPAALLTVAHIPTSCGLVEPVVEIGSLARAAGVPFLLDATQSIGQLPVNVGQIGADLLVATGRKFVRGPRGTGLLYVHPHLRSRLRPAVPDVRGAYWHADQLFDLDASAKQYETWEASPALRLGLGTALAEMLDLGLDRIQRHVTGLADRLRTGLAAIPQIVMADPEGSSSAIVTFVRDGQDPRDTVRELRTAAFHLVSVPASHGQWDLGRRGLTGVVRASVHVYNDTADVDALLAELAGNGTGRWVSR